MKSVTPYNRLTSEEPIMDYAVVEQGVSATPVVEKKRFIEDTIRKEFEPWFGDLTPKEFITQLNHQIDSYNNHNDQESVDEILYMVLDKILVLMNIDCMFNCWTYDQFIKRYKGLLVYLQELFPNIYIRDIKNLLTTYLVQMQTIPALSNSDFGVAFLSNNEDYQYNLIDHIEHVIVPNYEKLPTNKEVHLDNEKNEVQSEVTTCICNNLDKIRLFCEKYHKNNKAVTAHGDTANTATIGNNPGEKKVEFWINNKIIVEGRTSTRETPRTAVPAQDDDDDDDDTVDSKAIDIELGGGAKVVLPSSSPPSTVVVDHLSRKEEKDDATEDDKSDDDSLSPPPAYTARSKKKQAPSKQAASKKKPASKPPPKPPEQLMCCAGDLCPQLDGPTIIGKGHPCIGCNGRMHGGPCSNGMVEDPNGMTCKKCAKPQTGRKSRRQTRQTAPSTTPLATQTNTRGRRGQKGKAAAVAKVPPITRSSRRNKKK